MKSFKRESEALNERLDISFALEAAQLGVWELDPATNLINWDRRCGQLFGLVDSITIPYEQAARYIHPDDVDRVAQAVNQAMNPRLGGAYDITYRTIGDSDGLLRWVRFIGQGYFTDAGAVYRFAGVAQDVTKDVQTQQLEASEARFRSLIEEAPVATCLFVGRDMKIEVANESMLTVWGKGRSVMGQPLALALPELEDQPFVQILNEVFTTGQPYETKATPANLIVGGVLTMHYFDYTFKALRDAAGEVCAIMEMAVDVTGQVAARQQLEEQEQYFHQVTDSVPAIIWITEPDGCCSYLNKQWYDYTGQTEAAARGFGWLGATHPDDKEEVGRRFLEANEKRAAFSVLYRLCHKNGSYRWAIDKGSPRFAENGDYLGMIGTVVDVHDQKLAEEGLTQFKYMADNASDPFILMREDGTFAYLNKLALDRWGYTAEEATQIRVPDVDPVYNDVVFSAAFTRAQREKIHPFETLHRTKDGVTYPVEVNMGGLVLSQKPYLFAVARDISERKKAERALREREVLFRNVTNSSPTGLWLSNEAGGLTYLNRTLVDWSGLPYDDLLGVGWASAIMAEDRERSATVFLTAVAARAHYEVMFRIKKRDGSLMWCQAAGDPFYAEDGS
ncbi:MAG: PAS domain S-box protein, partial [Bacteroidetes bacterium]|nr:PAS domain S-box protein [Fibrella sp.]